MRLPSTGGRKLAGDVNQAAAGDSLAGGESRSVVPPLADFEPARDRAVIDQGHLQVATKAATGDRLLGACGCRHQVVEPDLTRGRRRCRLRRD